MAPPPHEHAFRVASVGAAIVGFILLLAETLVDIKHNYWRANISIRPSFLALIPLCLSAILGLAYLVAASKAKTYQLQSTARLGFDLILTCGYFAVLLPIWIVEPIRLKARGDFLMLETYGSCFLLINMVIHFYFFIYNFKGTNECPHCGFDTRRRGPSATKQVGKGARYSLLPENPYTDEPEEVAGPSETRPSEEQATEEV